MMNTYQEVLTFLYDNLPMFQRVGSAAINRDLGNTIRLCEILGNPQRAFKSIHVAGTNGKGSVSHMLASVMQSAGCRTGLYTSPHLKEFTERIRINGEEVAQSFVLDFVNRIRPAIEQIRPSFFEITVAMAFDYFARQRVDVAVIETGLGGRLDSTNVITPIVSVVTNISWDHKDILGDSLELIASEKAGIIKKGIPVVIGERQSDVEQVFINKAQAEAADLYFASDEYTATESLKRDALTVLRRGHPLFDISDFPLKGIYQQHNVPTVLKTLEVLRNSFKVSDDDIVHGLKDVVANTGLKGRWQILQRNPTVVCDTGHNEAGLREVVSQIERQQYNKLYIILGMVKDKDVKQVLTLMPSHAIYYFCQAKLPRAMDATLLQKAAADVGLQGSVIPDVNEAKRHALSRAKENDFIFIGGSTYVVAELE